MQCYNDFGICCLFTVAALSSLRDADHTNAGAMHQCYVIPLSCLQIEELQAQESQLRADAGQGDDQIPAVHALLSQLALASPEETEQALAELLHAAADSRCP